MTNSFLPDTEAEFLGAVQFFEHQYIVLGSVLINEFEHIVSLAVTRANAWKLVHSSGIRRIGLARFPYAVFYCVMPNEQVQITAFAHHRRRPDYWLKRTGA